jgi:hypothetical protein
MQNTAIAESVRAFIESCPADFDFPMGGTNAIPMKSENAILDSLEDAERLTRNAVIPIRDQLGLRQSYSMVIFAVRMAVLAVRTNTQHYLKAGFLGLAVAGRQVDWRDLLGALSIIEDCANRLGLEFRVEIEQCVALMADEARETLIDGYLSRLPEMRKVEVMGFVAQNCEAGLCYVCRGAS